MVADRDYNITGYTAPYWAARMINYEWVAHRSGVHDMYQAKTGVKDANGNLLVTSCAVKRPDGNWSVMLVNKDENNPHTVRIRFDDESRARQLSFTGPVTWVSIGSERGFHDNGTECLARADHHGPEFESRLRRRQRGGRSEVETVSLYLCDAPGTKPRVLVRILYTDVRAVRYSVS